jgi:predicted enzyme related to lactoylglutathione lyase
MYKVTHFEFPWDDKERAKAFYQSVFDWKPFEWEQFGYTSWQTGDVDERMQPKVPGFINGGSSKRDPEMPHPMFYVEVDDIDTVLEQVVAHGGSVVHQGATRCLYYHFGTSTRAPCSRKETSRFPKENKIKKNPNLSDF